MSVQVKTFRTKLAERHFKTAVGRAVDCTTLWTKNIINIYNVKKLIRQTMKHCHSINKVWIDKRYPKKVYVPVKQRRKALQLVSNKNWSTESLPRLFSHL